MSVVPHSAEVLAVFAVVSGPMPKVVRRVCRNRLTEAVKRLQTGEKIEPFRTASTDTRAQSVDFIRRVCATCRKCKGVGVKMSI